MARFCYLLLLVLATGCARQYPSASVGDEEFAGSIRAALKAGEQSANTSQGGVVLPDPTGFATFKGTFSARGEVKIGAGSSADKDQEVCAKGGKKIPDESVVVGPGGELSNVLVYLTTKIPDGDERWTHAMYKDVRHIDFDQKDCLFLTHVLAVRANQKLRVLNSDPVAHNTKVDGNGDAAVANFTVNPNDSAPFDVGGAAQSPYPVSCSIHPWMRAYMFTAPNAYFAVTGKNGQFEIQNVPAGVPLEFRVWQERVGYVESVDVNGEKVKWQKGRFSLTLKPDEVVDYKVAIDAAVLNK